MKHAAAEINVLVEQVRGQKNLEHGQVNMASDQGTLFTLSAPSGAGKTSLVEALVSRNPALEVSVSHTTRGIRPGERDGDNYHFIDNSQFVTMLAQGEFLEHALVYGNYYGTSKAWVHKSLAAGNDVILEIDWQGAAQIHSHMPDSVSIFILPPSLDALFARLRERGRDEEVVISDRLAQAKEDISHYPSADYLIVNELFEEALVDLEAIIRCQRLRNSMQQLRHELLLAELLA